MPTTTVATCCVSSSCTCGWTAAKTVGECDGLAGLGTAPTWYGFIRRARAWRAAPAVAALASPGPAKSLV